MLALSLSLTLPRAELCRAHRFSLAALASSPRPVIGLLCRSAEPLSSRNGGARNNWEWSSAKKGPGWGVNWAHVSQFWGVPGEHSVCVACEYQILNLAGFECSDTGRGPEGRGELFLKFRIQRWSRRPSAGRFSRCTAASFCNVGACVGDAGECRYMLGRRSSQNRDYADIAIWPKMSGWYKGW